LPLGDEFWLLAHNEQTGKPRLSDGILGLGLAAALIGEVVYSRNVTVRGGYVLVVDMTPPQDPLAHHVLAQMAAEASTHTTRTWLVYLGRGAAQQVGERLWRAGVLRQETSRRFLKQVTSYVPVDANKAGWPMARIATTLRRESPMEHADAFLAGLAGAAGLDRIMLDGAGPGPRRYLAHVVGGLAAPFHELVVQTQAAVGDAVLSQRA
jgi:Golgi phosphoprotein 3 (GPP34)